MITRDVAVLALFFGLIVFPCAFVFANIQFQEYRKLRILERGGYFMVQRKVFFLPLWHSLSPYGDDPLSTLQEAEKLIEHLQSLRVNRYYYPERKMGKLSKLIEFLKCVLGGDKGKD